MNGVDTASWSERLWLLDGAGGGRSLPPAPWTPALGSVWLDLTLTGEVGEPQAWAQALAMEPLLALSVGDLDHHPRLVCRGGGVLLCLREVVLDTGREEREALPCNLWSDGTRVVTVHRQASPLLERLATELERGRGPQAPGSLLAWLAEQLVAELKLRALEFDRRVESLGERIHDQDSRLVSRQLAQTQRQLSALLLDAEAQARLWRRLAGVSGDWLVDEVRHRLRESGARHDRLARRLVHARERLGQVQAEFANLLDHRLNERVYALTVLTGIFFPMVFLTGLLGVNLGGIPGSEQPWAFTFFCLLLMVLGAGSAWWFRRHRWL